MDCDARSDVYQKLLLTFGLFSLYSSLLGIDHALLLRLLVEFTFRDVGLEWVSS